LVEDLVSSGTTINLLIELVEQLGAQVVGVGCLWRRHVGGGRRQAGVQSRQS